MISFAQFYYMDQFILLTCGSRLHLYKYHIDTHTPDDIKRWVCSSVYVCVCVRTYVWWCRYNSNSRYKLVTSLQMDSSQSITALSAINDFHSCILLCEGRGGEGEGEVAGFFLTLSTQIWFLWVDLTRLWRCLI